MKWLFLVILLIATNAWAKPVKVKGYSKKAGTAVQPHKRSSPNRSKMDNQSTKGNLNPHTGKKGTRDPIKVPK